MLGGCCGSCVNHAPLWKKICSTKEKETLTPLLFFRDETELNTGVSHLAELMAFQSTHRLTVEELVSEVEKMGGEVNCHSSR